MQLCEDRMEDSRYESGHSYSGEIGMAHGIRWTGQRFTDRNAAYDWLEDNAEKWGPALGVALRDTEAGKTTFIFGAWCSS
jgi:hypothetical protein